MLLVFVRVFWEEGEGWRERVAGEEIEGWRGGVGRGAAPGVGPPPPNVFFGLYLGQLASTPDHQFLPPQSVSSSVRQRETERQRRDIKAGEIVGKKEQSQ